MSWKPLSASAVTVLTLAATFALAATPAGPPAATPAQGRGAAARGTVTPPPPEPPINIPLTIPADGSPQINGPLVTGATPGRPFLYRIPATGDRPMTFSVENLPAGLTVDANTGFISGSLRQPLALVTTLRAGNAKGQASRPLVIVGGTHKLALTPPLGWNSWNAVGMRPTDKFIRDTADAFVSSGFADHGYTYICIDDGWEVPLPGRGIRGQQGLEGTPRRAPDGTILTNEHFPDMKALGDHIHSKGLKFGIYSSPGPTTCQGFEASWQHEEQDARTWASWGVDYVKYDWCSYNQVASQAAPAGGRAGGATAGAAGTARGGRGGRGGDLPTLKRPYQVMRAALEKLDRDMVYSICQYGMGNVWEWADDPDIKGNLWRSTNDIRDNWPQVRDIGFSQNGREQWVKPGCWNDTDMLVVGKVGWTYEPQHETNLTQNEQLTHITLWAILASPLILGNDMTKLEDFTIRLMTHNEMLAIDQDPLGSQGKRISSRAADDSETGNANQRVKQVWGRKLLDGTMAIGLFNLGDTPIQVATTLEELNDALGMNLAGPQPVRDVWQLKNLAPLTDTFSADLPRHGCLFLKIGTPRPQADVIADIVKMHAPTPEVP